MVRVSSVHHLACYGSPVVGWFSVCFRRGNGKDGNKIETKWKQKTRKKSLAFQKNISAKIPSPPTVILRWRRFTPGLSLIIRKRYKIMILIKLVVIRRRSCRLPSTKLRSRNNNIRTPFIIRVVIMSWSVPRWLQRS